MMHEVLRIAGPLLTSVFITVHFGLNTGNALSTNASSGLLASFQVGPVPMFFLFRGLTDQLILRTNQQLRTTTVTVNRHDESVLIWMRHMHKGPYKCSGMVHSRESDGNLGGVPTLLALRWGQISRKKHSVTLEWPAPKETYIWNSEFTVPLNNWSVLPPVMVLM